MGKLERKLPCLEALFRNDIQFTRNRNRSPELALRGHGLAWGLQGQLYSSVGFKTKQKKTSKGNH